jgi:hypothetical protein
MKPIKYECRHIMPSGAKCHAVALKDRPYCYAHTRLHKFKAAPQIGVMDDLRLPFMEDRHSIQLSIAMIVDAFCTARIDSKHAGLLLYAVQLSTQNVDRTGDVVPAETVEITTETETGEEMAPEKFICDVNNCGACPDRDVCEYGEWDEEDDEETEQDGAEQKAPQPSPPAVPTARSVLSTAVRRALSVESRPLPLVNGTLPIVHAAVSTPQCPGSAGRPLSKVPGDKRKQYAGASLPRASAAPQVPQEMISLPAMKTRGRFGAAMK